MSEPVKKKELVPKLRFPEFSDAPSQWNVISVGDLCTSFSGGTPATGNPAFYGGDIPFIRSAEIGKQRTELTLTEAGLARSSAQLVSKGDVLIALYGANSGDVARAKLDGAINQAVLCLKCPLSEGFVFSSFERMQSRIVASYIQGGQGNLSGEIVRALRLPVSTAEEQRKIAECLESLDELIAAEAEKLEALKRHKKGLLQQLFPAEGETTPRLRFPRFRNEDGWGLKSVGDLLDILSGFPFDGTAIVEDTFGVPILRGVNITEGRIRHGKDIDRFFLGDTSSLERFRVRSGDLVIAMDGSKVGKNSAIVGPADESALLVQRVARLRSVDSLLCRFVFQTVHSERFHRYVDRVNTSSGIPHISGQQIAEFPVAVPCADELKAVLGVMEEIQAAIGSNDAKLHNLRSHKAALMQQLFPSMEEEHSNA